jgi:hypothetical protein
MLSAGELILLSTQTQEGENMVLGPGKILPTTIMITKMSGGAHETTMEPPNVHKTVTHILK